MRTFTAQLRHKPLPREPKDFVVLCQLILGVSAFYGISVRQLAALPLDFGVSSVERFLQTFPRGFALALS